MAKTFQDTITVKFIGKGKGLERTIKALDKATKSLIKSQAKLTAEGKRVKDVQKKLATQTTITGEKVGILTTRNKRLAQTNSLLANTFATIRSKLLLVNFALGLGIRQISKMVTESAKVDSMETAFQTLAGATENSTIALNKLKEATNNTMSEFDLFQQANNAMILGVSKNSDEMAEMFDIAQRLGRALGRDTASSVESLITGIGRQSRLMLDNIGIIVKSEEAYEAYADKLKITVDEMSDAEKKQAFLNATMESARQKVQTLGKETLTTQDTFDKLGASSANLAKEIGVSLSPAFSTLAINTSNVFNNLTELLSILNHTKGAELQLIEATNKAESSIETLSGKYNIAIDSSKGLVAQLRELQSNTKLAHFRKDELRITILKLTEAQALYEKSLKDGESADEADKKFKAKKEELKAIEDGLIAEQKAFQETADKEAKRNFEQEQRQKEQAEAYQKHLDTKTMMDDAYFDGLTMASKDANDELKAMLKDLTNANTAYFSGFTMAQTEASRELQAMQDEMDAKNAQFMSNINSSIGALDGFLSSWQSNMRARMDAEISTLKDSESYKMADTERRKDMERKITKGYKDEQMKQFRIGQASALADIAMSTSSAIMKSVAGAWVSIGQPWAGIIASLGLAQAGMVLTQSPPSYEQGGLVGGRRHSQGGTMIEAERGEFVMSRNAVESIGVEALNNMNQGGGAITVNISAPLVDETVIDHIIPAINKAQRMNLA